MPSTTITISTEAHAILSRLKQGKESFSDVILRHVRLPADTRADLMERIEKQAPPAIDPALLDALRSSRGRRSSRSTTVDQPRRRLRSRPRFAPFRLLRRGR